jgi:hypothetical protein
MTVLSAVIEVSVISMLEFDEMRAAYQVHRKVPMDGRPQSAHVHDFFHSLGFLCHGLDVPLYILCRSC